MPDSLTIVSKSFQHVSDPLIHIFVDKNKFLVDLYHKKGGENILSHLSATEVA
jgi:hypothetical protein